MSDSRKAVFLSYASQDAEAAKRICEALRTAGVEVWLDQSELVGGDAWDQKIRGQIKECALFIPVISANTQARREGYFRIEWKLAAQRTHAFADGTPFLLPVVIDATRDADALVPEEFRAVQWTRLRQAYGGQAPDDATEKFCERVQRLLGGDAAGAPSRREESRESPRKAASTKSQKWRAVIGAAFVVVGLSLWQPWKTPQPAAAPLAKSAAPAAQKDDKSIAVLPFENQSDDKENTTFFSDGMHEDILTNLANIRDLRVVSRTSVMEYRGTKKKIPQIAQELGVAYILEGSVRRSGNQVKITGQLIRAANDQHLWAKSYERELSPKEVFAIQAALATEIAGELKATLSPREKTTLARMPTQNLEAYDLFLKAREIRNGDRFTFATFQERETLLQRAVELDPAFGPAWSELSRVHGFVYRRYEMTDARQLQAKTSIEKAVRLAPDAPDVIKDLGSYYFTIDGNFVRAIEHYQQALHLRPNDADAHRMISNARTRLGDWTGGILALRRAIELEPDDVPYSRFMVSRLLAGRRYPDARAEQSRLVKLRSGAPDETFELAYISFLASGSPAEVDKFLAQLAPADRESPRMIFYRKAWAATRGNYPEFERLDRLQPHFETDEGARLKETMLRAMVLAESDLSGARAHLSSLPSELKSRADREPLNYWPWGARARVEAMLGNREEALRCAQRAAELVTPHEQPSVTDTAAALAFVHMWTGQPEHALAELTRLMAVPQASRAWSSEYAFTNVHEMRRHPAFAPLRNDPRFQALLNDAKNNAPLF
jgi:TolB-like protein